MAILTFEQRHNLGKVSLFCQLKMYSALYIHPDFSPYYPFPFSGGQNTEFSQYIEEDMIYDMIQLINLFRTNKIFWEKSLSFIDTT